MRPDTFRTETQHTYGNSMRGESAGDIPKCSEIERQMNLLNERLDSLEKIIVFAHERLRLVVVSVPHANGVDKAETSPPMSPMGEAIERASARVYGYTNQLGALLESVAL